MASMPPPYQPSRRAAAPLFKNSAPRPNTRPPTKLAPRECATTSAAATLAPAFGGMFSTQTSQRIQHALVDVLDDVKDTELVTSLGPHLCHQRWIKVRAIGGDHTRQEAPVLEVLQKPAHVRLVVGRHEGEGNGEIGQGIGSQQQGTMTQMDFVDGKGAGEFFESPTSVLRHMDLTDLPIEAVVEKACRQIQVKISCQRLLESFHAHTVVEQAVDDCLANAIGVFGPAFDPGDL